LEQPRTLAMQAGFNHQGGKGGKGGKVPLPNAPDGAKTAQAIIA
jgi:hypothetical protein